MTVLIVGLGVMGQNHLRVARGLGLDVVTVDPDPSKGADHRLLKHALVGRKATAACIAVPPDYLSVAAGEAVDAGLHVLVEKPFALSVDAAHQVNRRAQDKGLTLAVGYTERHSPVVRALKRRLSEVGTVGRVSARRLSPPPKDRLHVSPLWDLATHDFDVLHYLGLTQWHHVEAALNAPRWDFVALRTTGGILASVEASHDYPGKVRNLTVTGMLGMFTLDYQRQTLDWYDEQGTSQERVKGNEPLLTEWCEFLDAIEDRCEPTCSGADAIQTLQLTESCAAIYRFHPEAILQAPVRL